MNESEHNTVVGGARVGLSEACHAHLLVKISEAPEARQNPPSSYPCFSALVSSPTVIGQSFAPAPVRLYKSNKIWVGTRASHFQLRIFTSLLS